MTREVSNNCIVIIQVHGKGDPFDHWHSIWVIMYWVLDLHCMIILSSHVNFDRWLLTLNVTHDNDEGVTIIAEHDRYVRDFHDDSSNCFHPEDQSLRKFHEFRLSKARCKEFQMSVGIHCYSESCLIRARIDHVRFCCDVYNPVAASWLQDSFSSDFSPARYTIVIHQHVLWSTIGNCTCP